MGKTVIVILGLFVLAMGAGVVGGMLVSRQAGPPEPSAPLPVAGGSGNSDLVAQLQLSPQQAEQMRKIWEGVQGRVQSCVKDLNGLPGQRDEEIMGMLNDEQKAKFEQLSQKYKRRHDLLARQRERDFADGVEQTRGILSPAQWLKYEEIVKERTGRDAASMSPLARPTD